MFTSIQYTLIMEHRRKGVYDAHRENLPILGKILRGCLRMRHNKSVFKNAFMTVRKSLNNDNSI